MIEHRVYGETKKISKAILKDTFHKMQYIQIALLFGSRATNNYTPKSDYDFAVFGNKEFPYGIQAEVWAELSRTLDLDMDDVDVVDLNRVDSVLKDSIREKYILLKGSYSEVSRLLAKN